MPKLAPTTRGRAPALTPATETLLVKTPLLASGLHGPLPHPAGPSGGEASGEDRVKDFIPAGRGHTYQLREVIRCLQRGQTESATLTLADSLMTMSLLDQTPKQSRIRYPAD
jgi:hypothetical protein